MGPTFLFSFPIAKQPNPAHLAAFMPGDRNAGANMRKTIRRTLRAPKVALKREEATNRRRYYGSISTGESEP